jgi:hypothetical protein
LRRLPLRLGQRQISPWLRRRTLQQLARQVAGVLIVTLGPEDIPFTNLTVKNIPDGALFAIEYT